MIIQPNSKFVWCSQLQPKVGNTAWGYAAACHAHHVCYICTDKCIQYPPMLISPLRQHLHGRQGEQWHHARVTPKTGTRWSTTMPCNGATHCLHDNHACLHNRTCSAHEVSPRTRTHTKLRLWNTLKHNDTMQRCHATHRRCVAVPHTAAWHRLPRQPCLSPLPYM